MEAIVAVFSDWGIGSEGTQQLVLKADRAHFRELTAGAAVIVGRRTLADFPGGRPLKGRNNIVVTRQNLAIEGAEVAHSTGEALALAEKYPRTLVIGGASVYRQFLPYVDTVHLTQIDRAPASDSFFEDLDASPDWQAAEVGDWQEENGVRYRFATYRRV
ncbi:MAG: dihydrofolate reductase [Oscillospiraceae bacterium]|nr:dihydrofolate reductase [Oscillospiraceae bacterium]